MTYPPQKRQWAYEENPGRIENMEKLVAEHTYNFPALITSSPKYTDEQQDIDNWPLEAIFTASPGSVSFHLLSKILADVDIWKVWCLSESGSHIDPLVGGNSGRHNWKLRHMKIDLSQRSLGLNENQWLRLTNDADIIVHTAGKESIDRNLSFFESEMEGLRGIIELSLSNQKRPRIHFQSSILSVAGWPSLYWPKNVPEEPLALPQLAASSGFAESKRVAETILSIASQRLGVPVTIYRVGQIVSSTIPGDKAWHEREWLPSLVKTSKALGMIPAGLADINWIPIDKIGDILKETIHSDLKKDGIQVYNVVNPRRRPWRSIRHILSQYCGENTKFVSLDKWFEALESMDVETPRWRELLGINAAPNYSTVESRKASTTLDRLSEVNDSWLQNWLERASPEAKATRTEIAVETHQKSLEEATANAAKDGEELEICTTEGPNEGLEAAAGRPHSFKRKEETLQRKSDQLVEISKRRREAERIPTDLEETTFANSEKSLPATANGPPPPEDTVIVTHRFKKGVVKSSLDNR